MNGNRRGEGEGQLAGMGFQRQEHGTEERCQSAPDVGRPKQEESEPSSDLKSDAEPPVMGDRHRADRQRQGSAKRRRHPNQNRPASLHRPPRVSRKRSGRPQNPHLVKDGHDPPFSQRLKDHTTLRATRADFRVQKVSLSMSRTPAELVPPVRRRPSSARTFAPKTLSSPSGALWPTAPRNFNCFIANSAATREEAGCPANENGGGEKFVCKDLMGLGSDSRSPPTDASSRSGNSPTW